MVLTKNDLDQIRTIVKEEGVVTERRINVRMDKGFNRLEKKLDDSFNFLDLDLSPLELPPLIQISK